MAETYDPGLLPRTYFRAPRVPFDFKALLLAVAGWVVYWAGGELVSSILADKDARVDTDVPGAFLTALFSLFMRIPYMEEACRLVLTGVFGVSADLALKDYTTWEILVGGLWFFAVWAFFGQAIHRITTLRIARDEGLGLFEALRFAARNWTTMLLVPVIVGGAIGFFWLCNMAAGALTSIPFLGGVLGLILLPLAFVSTLLILLIAVGGIFGLPLIGAAAAWECNGSLDAISRAFSYLFARPLQFFWNYFLIFMFTGVILLVGVWFITTLVVSVDDGTWSKTQEVLIDAAPQGTERANNYDGETREWRAAVERELGQDGLRAQRGADGVRAPLARHFQAVVEAPWGYKLNALVFWVLLNLAAFGIYGYAVYWMIGASSSVYADLRADVDGTDEDEVYLEEEEEDLDSLAEGGPTYEGAAAAELEAKAQAAAESETRAPEPPAAGEPPAGPPAGAGMEGSGEPTPKDE